MNYDKTILLVDDVEFFLELMQRYLQKTPVNTLTAGNGRQAIDLALERSPDVICMDASMPEMNGAEACQAIKAHPKLQKIPVILIYNPENAAETSQVANAPCDGTLTKPLLREEFMTLTQQYLFHLDRRERRVSCQMTIECRIGDDTFQGMGVDISRSGVYIEYRGRIPEGQRANLSFYLASVSPNKLELSGNVAWINQGHPRPNMSLPQGLGIVFDRIPAGAMDTLNRYITEN